VDGVDARPASAVERVLGGGMASTLCRASASDCGAETRGGRRISQSPRCEPAAASSGAASVCCGKHWRCGASLQ
jgi:hypothetical protein